MSSARPSAGSLGSLTATEQSLPWWRGLDAHPVARLVIQRTLVGLLTLVVVSMIIFAATEVLPGNAANAILGHGASPARVRALTAQLHLDRSVVSQYWSWVSGLVTGNPGTSLANQRPVGHLVGPWLVNSAFLVVVSGVIATLLAMALGIVAAVRHDGIFDHAVSTVSLTLTALPEFVIGVALVLVFSTSIFHVLPGVAPLPPGVYPWQRPSMLVLPCLTLILVVIPYTFRMMRAAMIEALQSDYVELAELKGLKRWRVVMVHALPNALAPTAQVIGISFLYLAGGIVVVEFVFDYPGIGTGLINAVSARDVPVIQFVVLVLAAFYVVVNVVSDVIALLVTPKRRIAR